MKQAEKITEHFDPLKDEAHGILSDKVYTLSRNNPNFTADHYPRYDSLYAKLLDYTTAILEQKSGETVDLGPLQTDITEMAGNHLGKELIKTAQDAVDQAILDAFGPGFYGKGKG